MSDNQQNIKLLLDRMDALMQRQEAFSLEINALKEEIINLQDKEQITSVKEKQDLLSEENNSSDSRDFPVSSRPKIFPKSPSLSARIILEELRASEQEESKRPGIRFNLEKFIGENLISKIGIVIIVLGVAIGARYAIENDWVSPLTRIILGYLSGMLLVGFAVRLKNNYRDFSAVLLSGAMAIIYFITFAAYSFYGLMPQLFAFGLMVILTAFTVFASLRYNRQVIALFGLVGAYAVPFLLSDGSGNIGTLFTYMTIINAGILIIALHRYWKKLYFFSFIVSWIIYLSWFVFRYRQGDDFTTAFAVNMVFFLTFYLAFLGYKFKQDKLFTGSDIVLLLINSFVFYGVGYSILQHNETGKDFLGLFTLLNALLHFLVSMYVTKKETADRNLFFMVSGVAMAFTTLSVPVQLEGNWVTLLWAFEAAVLFWVGRSKAVFFYETISYFLMVLAIISLLHDWTMLPTDYYVIDPAKRIPFLFNIHFLSALFFLLAFILIYMVKQKFPVPQLAGDQRVLAKLFSYGLPGIILITIYFTFRLEISIYWGQLFNESRIAIDIENANYPNYQYNYDLIRFKKVWLINYTLLFLSLLAFLNIKKLKTAELGFINMALVLFAVLVFYFQGLFVISELRDSYLNQSLAEFYPIGNGNIIVRYLSFVFLAISLLSLYFYPKQDFMDFNLPRALRVFFPLAILWLASSELIHWMDMSGTGQSHKLGLSILWGIFSLFWIAYGIWKKLKYLRILAISLFAITLIKLFFYDISNLDTISKTIVFVALGILLLMISFLYNKYRHFITDEPEA